jgi:hypothetical protein
MAFRSNKKPIYSWQFGVSFFIPANCSGGLAMTKRSFKGFQENADVINYWYNKGMTFSDKFDVFVPLVVLETHSRLAA